MLKLVESLAAWFSGAMSIGVDMKERESQKANRDKDGSPKQVTNK